jgi:hypothetical protein
VGSWDAQSHTWTYAHWGDWMGDVNGFAAYPEFFRNGNWHYAPGFAERLDQYPLTHFGDELNWDDIVVPGPGTYWVGATFYWGPFSGPGGGFAGTSTFEWYGTVTVP